MREMRRACETFVGKREAKRILGYRGIWKLIVEEQAEKMCVPVACSCE
jgi:hypothetical protein